GVARKSKAATIEHGLADRIGYDGACLAFLDEAYRVLNRLLDNGSSGLVWAPRDDCVGHGDRKNRKLFGEALLANHRVGNGRDRHSQAEGFGPHREHARIAEKDERRNRLVLAREPGEQRDVRPNPSGVAEGERQGTFGKTHGQGLARIGSQRYSMNASWRRSRNSRSARMLISSFTNFRCVSSRVLSSPLTERLPQTAYISTADAV